MFLCSKNTTGFSPLSSSLSFLHPRRDAQACHCCFALILESVDIRGCLALVVRSLLSQNLPCDVDVRIWSGSGYRQRGASLNWSAGLHIFAGWTRSCASVESLLTEWNWDWHRDSQNHNLSVSGVFEALPGHRLLDRARNRPVYADLHIRTLKEDVSFDAPFEWSSDGDGTLNGRCDVKHGATVREFCFEFSLRESNKRKTNQQDCFQHLFLSLVEVNQVIKAW